MAELTNAGVQRLLLLMANYGHVVSRAMADAAPGPELVDNVSLVVLCTLELEGPRRPGALQEVTGLSSGGVSKLLDRMERAGVVKRTYGGVAGDNRGVLVAITRRGRSTAARFAGAVAKQLPDGRVILKDIAAAIDL